MIRTKREPSGRFIPSRRILAYIFYFLFCVQRLKFTFKVLFFFWDDGGGAGWDRTAGQTAGMEGLRRDGEEEEEVNISEKDNALTIKNVYTIFLHPEPPQTGEERFKELSNDGP